MSRLPESRTVRVPALAKINLDLRVLGKRPDGYHELRTVFQTISLADRIALTWTPGRRTTIELNDPLAIPNNLVVRAAKAALGEMRVAGHLAIELQKRIPMGAGLGGGSSDAAAILLALPVLTGKPLSIETLSRLAAELGSDVPFFLLGGTAAGIGRGTELFPLPDAAPAPGLLVTPGLHVNTAAAYAALSPRLTTSSQPLKILSFQSNTWNLGRSGEAGQAVFGSNDFEPVVFEQHRVLAGLKRRLRKAGASWCMMTGSGSAIAAVFPDRDSVSRALRLFDDKSARAFTFVGRSRYRALWRRSLAPYVNPNAWPPQDR